MTSKRKPVRPAWRSLARYVDADGPWLVDLGPRSRSADPSMAPAATLADRYTATAIGDPPDLLVTVTDRETQAAVTLPADMAEVDALRLWRDARAIVGIAKVQRGGPAIGTGLQPSQLIEKTVALWNPDPPPEGTPPTQAEVADATGTDHDGRTVRRVGALLPGPGKPWERVLRNARIARRQ
jgi:hypothetical protein